MLEEYETFSPDQEFSLMFQSQKGQNEKGKGTLISMSAWMGIEIKQAYPLQLKRYSLCCYVRLPQKNVKYMYEGASIERSLK